jgi:hypothetical protein
LLLVFRQHIVSLVTKAERKNAAYHDEERRSVRAIFKQFEPVDSDLPALRYSSSLLPFSLLLLLLLLRNAVLG